MKILIMNKKYFKLLFFATAIVVFILATVSDDHVHIHHQYADKIKHITAFFTLSLLLNRASSTIAHRLRNMIALLLFGLFIEVAQYFIPSRDSDWMDVLADFIGILFFQLSYSSFKTLKELRERGKIKSKSL